MFELEKQKLKECPFCGGTLKRGKIEITDTGSLFNTNVCVNFAPEEESGKLIGKNRISLRTNADGYYCDECVQFFGVYERRY